MWNKPLKKLLENVPMGYAYHKIIANTSEGKVDYEFLKFNPLFQRIMGLEKSDLEKNKWSDIPPEKRDHTIYRSDIFKKIALQGGYETYNCFSNQLDRWFKVHVFSPQEGFFMTLLVDISQEKEQLKQFESFFNINLDLLCIADSEGRFVKLNKEWERLLGYQIDELEGRFFLDFVHPQDIQKTKEAMEKLNHKDDVLNFSNRYLTKNGDYKIIEWRSHPHGHFIFAAARDITTSRARERELIAILETTIDGFFIADVAGNITRVNAAFCNMLGYEKNELLQMNILDLEASESKEAIKQQKEMVKETGSGRFQTKVSRKDGTILEVEISVTLFTVEFPQMIVFIRDISQQKKANLELEKREKQFSSLFWDSPVSILIHDKDTGQVIEANYKALSLYGVDNIDDFDFDMMMCEAPYSCEEAKEWIKKTITDGPQNFEWRARRKDGEYFWEQINLKQMDYYGEQVVIATGIDITQLKETQKEAEAAGRVKTEFLSNMSHEIRTPLNGIIGFTDLLKNTPLDTAQKQFLDSISLNANSLLSIIDDILDFSQIQEDKLHLEQTLSDLKLLIEESVETVQQEVLKKRLDLLVNMDEKLPKYAYIDNRRLKQILTNLLSNAVKFTERGKVVLTVRFTGLSEKTGIYFFSVKDTGIGMSKEQQKHIFTPFSQGDTSTTKKFGGTGLGLIISQRIAQKMGSEIKFESELFKGSTFYFKIEAEYKNAPENTSLDEVKIKDRDKQIDDHTHETWPHLNHKFLIVDDVETSRFLFREYLKDFNKDIRILEASNGEDAVAIIKNEQPDLVLMDLYMPLLDGLKATEMIRDYEKRHQLKRTIIFALTATATKDQEKECYNTGMDAYLTKPLKKAQLYEKVRYFWDPPKKVAGDVSEEQLSSIKNHELASSLTPLRKMLMRNDLSALDFLENHEQILNDLGYTDQVKKIKKKVVNLDYKEALKVLNVIIKASEKSLKKGQPNG